MQTGRGTHATVCCLLKPKERTAMGQTSPATARKEATTAVGRGQVILGAGEGPRQSTGAKHKAVAAKGGGGGVGVRTSSAGRDGHRVSSEQDRRMTQPKAQRQGCWHWQLTEFRNLMSWLTSAEMGLHWRSVYISKPGKPYNHSFLPSPSPGSWLLNTYQHTTA